jgi:hypothetical protein
MLEGAGDVRQTFAVGEQPTAAVILPDPRGARGGGVARGDRGEDERDAAPARRTACRTRAAPFNPGCGGSSGQSRAGHDREYCPARSSVVGGSRDVVPRAVPSSPTTRARRARALAFGATGHSARYERKKARRDDGLQPVMMNGSFRPLMLIGVRRLPGCLADGVKLDFFSPPRSRGRRWRRCPRRDTVRSTTSPPPAG